MIVVASSYDVWNRAEKTVSIWGNPFSFEVLNSRIRKVLSTDSLSYKEHHTCRLILRIYTFLSAKFYLLVKRFRDRNRQLQALFYPAEMNLHLKIHH